MKLPSKNIQVETSEVGVDTSFGIGSLNIIFDILRNKLYSDVIGSVAREYSCNARDAHREIGKSHVPIEIHLPNTFDLNYKIKDNGPGISPNRMKDIFVNYAASTKRNDNIQGGFFGIGSKSAFSYTSQFSIITTTPSIFPTSHTNNTTIHTTRHYIAFIDQTEVGKIRLVREEVTTEPCGTEIIVAVEQKDCQAFINATLNATRFWDVKPILKGITPTPEYKEEPGQLLAEGSNWKVYSPTHYMNSDYNDSSKPIFDYNDSYAIVDGIPYKIDDHAIAQTKDGAFNDDLYNLLNYPLRLFFNIGELTLSASREQLQYDENTRRCIINRLTLIKNELANQFEVQLELQKTYTDAVVFVSEFFNNFRSFVDKTKYKYSEYNNSYNESSGLTWQNNKIYGSRIHLYDNFNDNLNGVSVIKFGLHASYKSSSPNYSLRMAKNNELEITKKSVIYYNDIDTNKISRSRIKYILENNKDITSIQLITSKKYGLNKDKFINGWKNLKADGSINQKNIAFDLNLLDVNLLSSIIIPKIKKIKPVKSINTYKAFQFDTLFYGRHINKINKYWKPIETIFDEKDCYYVVLTGKKVVNTGNLKDLSGDDLRLIVEYIDPKLKVIGVKEQYISKLNNNYKPLYDLFKKQIEKSIKNLSEDEINEIISANKYKDSNVFNHIDIIHDNYLFKYLLENHNNIQNKTNPLFKLLSFLNNCRSIYENNIDLIHVLKFIYNEDKIEKCMNNWADTKIKLENKIKSRYPLLRHLDVNDYYMTDKKYNVVIDYINLVDKALEKENIK